MINLLKKNKVDFIDFLKNIAQYCYDLRFARDVGHKPLEEIRKYLEQGVSVKNRVTAFIQALQENQNELMQLLLETGLDVTAKGCNDEIALHVLCEKGKLEWIPLSLQPGANINVQNNDGETALHLACRLGDINIVQRLLELGANKTIKNKKGETPFQYAIAFCNRPIVYHLLASGIDLNITDNEGDTVLHLAAKIGWAFMVRLLLESGADLKAENSRGESALMCATKKGWMDIIQILQAAYIKESGIACTTFLQVLRVTKENPKIQNAFPQPIREEIYANTFPFPTMEIESKLFVKNIAVKTDKILSARENGLFHHKPDCENTNAIDYNHNLASDAKCTDTLQASFAE